MSTLNTISVLCQMPQGIYLTGTVDENDRLIGSCIDAVMPVEFEPAQILVSLEKESYTCEQILKNKRFALSFVPKNINPEIIRTFGFNTSKTHNKWQETPYFLEDGLPVLTDCSAYLILSVVSWSETHGHIVFLCNVKKSVANTKEDMLLYSDWRNEVKHKLTNERKNKMSEKQWVCTVCGYIYDGDEPFESLPDDWVCPICGEGKDVFVEQ